MGHSPTKRKILESPLEKETQHTYTYAYTHIYMHASVAAEHDNDLQESQRAQAAECHAWNTPQRVVAQDPAEEEKKEKKRKRVRLSMLFPLCCQRHRGR